MPTPLPESSAQQAAAATAGTGGKITITPEMSEKLSPRWPLPKDEGGTERRGIDPLTLAADREHREEADTRRKDWTRRYGTGDQEP